MLAFYLVKFPPAWSWRKTLGICIPAFLVGYLVTGAGYVMMQRAFPGNYAYLEIVWYFAGINVFLMTAPVFILVQKAAARPAHGFRGWRVPRSASTSATSSSCRPATTSCNGFRDFRRWCASR